MKYDLLTSFRIQSELRTREFGKKIYAFWRVTSTNEFANRAAAQGEKEGTVVIAEEQTRGRGRMKRGWDSQFGKGLWFSLILRPSSQLIKAGLYPYLAGVSVAEAIETCIGLKPDFKWPNDLLHQQRKFCGILSEVEFINNRIHFIVVGIGINVAHDKNDFPKELRQNATSLEIETGSRINRISLFAEIIKRLEENYHNVNAQGFDGILKKWKERCPTIGHRIQVLQGQHHFEGIFENLDEGGCLLLRTEDARMIRIITGDLF